jgi:hypothetical protein
MAGFEEGFKLMGGTGFEMFVAVRRGVSPVDCCPKGF